MVGWHLASDRGGLVPRLGEFFSELKRRRILPALLGWGVVSFAVLQIVEPVLHALHLPDGVLTWVVAALALGFPITVVLAWFFDLTRAGLVRTPEPSAEGGAPARGRIAFLAALTAAAALGAAGAIWWRGVDRASNGPADGVERALADLLRKFRADRYPLPPWFVARVEAHVGRALADPQTRTIYPRMKRYWPMISRKLGERGLPEELGYIAWEESGFDPEARSSVGAAGMWQFMPTTARRYGLRVESGLDDRLDAERSTEAAARYLADLMALFGSDSFMLVIASYNKGESKMSKVLFDMAQAPGGLRPEDRTFWHFYRRQALAPDTMEYVPRILAIAVICHDPRRYGLE